MSITIECRRCGKKYHVKNELAGHNLRCKVCGGPMRVPIPHVGQVYSHAARTKEVELVRGNPRHIKAIAEHITRNIGPISSVLHEPISDLVHIDIHVVGPTPRRPYATLVTSGMSDRPMKTPDVDDKDSQFAELMLCLPDDWPLDEASLDDETNYWPIRWLKLLARFPHEYDTWFGLGHTIPNGDPPKPFAANTDLCCWLLTKPQIAQESFHHLIIGEQVVNFYAAIPIYPQEINYKLHHGSDKLVDHLLKNEITELLDPHRENVCIRSEW